MILKDKHRLGKYLFIFVTFFSVAVRNCNRYYLANKYMLKVSDRKTKIKFETCSELVKTPGRCH